MPGSSSSVRQAADPVSAYAKDVLDGRYVVGKLVIAAARRHMDDLARTDLRFDADEAIHAISFFPLLRHYKGKWGKRTVEHPTGMPLELRPWQQFIVGSTFGWKRLDGRRRFRVAYVEVARKQGKSTMAAGVAIKLAFFDAEPGAEVYTAATVRDQAKIVWGDCSRMVQNTPALRRRIQLMRSSSTLLDDRTASKLVPLGKDEDSIEGLNVHGAIIDELHVHKDAETLNALETASGSREQPLRFIITTAGVIGSAGPWEDLRRDAINIVTRVVEADEQFVYIATLDEEDDPWDENVWAKGNPNLGISVDLDELREAAAAARRTSVRTSSFLRRRLNVPVQAERHAIDLREWDRNADKPEPKDGDWAYGGLDLASTRDLASFTLILPKVDVGKVDVLMWLWCPQDGIEERSREDGVPYDQWAEQGLIKPTPGNVIDYDIIREDIKALAARFNILEIGYDRWNATQLITQLVSDGATCVPISQSLPELTAPTKEMERRYLEHEYRHGGHPVLRWMAANVVPDDDGQGNWKPSKRRSAEKIDGIMTLVMAEHRYKAGGVFKPKRRRFTGGF